MSWLFGTSMADIMKSIMTWVVNTITDAFSQAFATLKTILVSTPDVTQLPQVQTLTARTTTTLDVIFVLAFLAAGVMTVVAGGNEKAQYTAKQLMPRLIFGFIVAHFSPLFCSKLITLADAVSLDLAGGPPNRLGALASIDTQLKDSGVDHTAPLLFAVLAGIILVLFIGVAFSFVTRLGVLVILAMTGPLALACYALPQIEGVAKLWWRSLIGCLAIPLLQVLALESGETVLLNPHTAGFLYGTSGGGVMNLLIVISLLWTAVKIPGLVRTNVMKATGGNFGLQVVKVLVIQRGLKALTGRKSS